MPLLHRGGSINITRVIICAAADNYRPTCCVLWVFVWATPNASWIVLSSAGMHLRYCILLSEKSTLFLAFN